MVKTEMGGNWKSSEIWFQFSCLRCKVEGLNRVAEEQCKHQFKVKRAQTFNCLPLNLWNCLSSLSLPSCRERQGAALRVVWDVERVKCLLPPPIKNLTVVRKLARDWNWYQVACVEGLNCKFSLPLYIVLLEHFFWDTSDPGKCVVSVNAFWEAELEQLPACSKQKIPFRSCCYISGVAQLLIMVHQWW